MRNSSVESFYGLVIKDPILYKFSCDWVMEIIPESISEEAYEKYAKRHSDYNFNVKKALLRFFPEACRNSIGAVLFKMHRSEVYVPFGDSEDMDGADDNILIGFPQEAFPMISPLSAQIRNKCKWYNWIVR